MKYFIILLFIPSLCFSEIKGYIETGKDINYNIAYTELQIGYNFYLWGLIIYPYGNTKTWFEIKGTSGYPFNDIYTVGMDVKYSKLIFNLSHLCSHKVISDNSDYIYQYQPPADGNLTKISVRYEF